MHVHVPTRTIKKRNSYHKQNGNLQTLTAIFKVMTVRVGADYNCNRLHFLCNHNHNCNHTFSKLDVIVIMLCNHL